jgi:hypothetical protein
MPFGGVVVSVGMKGDDLKLVLNAGQASKGGGAYLQTTANTKFDNGKWVISSKSLDLNRSYQVAINDFLLTGVCFKNLFDNFCDWKEGRMEDWKYTLPSFQSSIHSFLQRSFWGKVKPKSV